MKDEEITILKSFCDQNNFNLTMDYFIKKKFHEARDSLINNGNSFLGITNEINKSTYYLFLARIYENLLDYENTKIAWNKFLEFLPKDIQTTYGVYKYIMNDYHNYKITILKNWIIQNGGYISDKIHIDYYGLENRGTSAKQSIDNKEQLMTIPFKCMISLGDLEENTEWCKKLKQNLDEKYYDGYIPIILELLHIKYTENHIKKPIIECFPKNFPTFPIHFTDDEKKEFEGSCMLFFIMERIDYLEKIYEDIQQILDIKYSYEDYIWATNVVYSRCFGYNKENKKKYKDIFIVPILDMVNHSKSPNTKWSYDIENKMFNVVSDDIIKTGDTIYDTYGDKSNYTYFLNYGFVLDNNKYDTLFTDFPYLDELKNHAWNIGYTINEEYKNMYDQLLPVFGNEQKVMFSHLLEYYKKRLSFFPTSLKVDMEILKKEDLPINYRNCVIVRKGEKKLLHFFVDFYTLFLEFYKKGNDKNKTRKKIRKLCSENNAFNYTELEKIVNKNK